MFLCTCVVIYENKYAVWRRHVIIGTLGGMKQKDFCFYYSFGTIAALITPGDARHATRHTSVLDV